jgi:hypothetical protein
MNKDTSVPPRGFDSIKNRLGTRTEIDAILLEAFEGRPGPFSFENIASILQRKLMSRIPSFTLNALVAMTRSFAGKDTIASYLSIEFPPQWAFLLLCVTSNVANGVQYLLKNLKLLDDCKMFSSSLNNCSQLFEELPGLP